jgi:hypothetical protein
MCIRFPDNFPIHNGLKKGDTLSQLRFNFALEYTIREVQRKQVGLKLSATHQFLSYSDGLSLLGDDIDTINTSTVTLIDAGKEVGLEVNVEKPKYMLVFRDQNAGQHRDINIANILCENVSQFKYLGRTVTNQNLILEEIKKKLNFGNACYHSVQNLLSSRLLSKNVKVKINKCIILPVVL